MSRTKANNRLSTSVAIYTIARPISTTDLLAYHVVLLPPMSKDCGLPFFIVLWDLESITHANSFLWCFISVAKKTNFEDFAKLIKFRNTVDLINS